MDAVIERLEAEYEDVHLEWKSASSWHRTRRVVPGPGQLLLEGEARELEAIETFRDAMQESGQRLRDLFDKSLRMFVRQQNKKSAPKIRALEYMGPPINDARDEEEAQAMAAALGRMHGVYGEVRSISSVDRRTIVAVNETLGIMRVMRWVRGAYRSILKEDVGYFPGPGKRPMAITPNAERFVVAVDGGYRVFGLNEDEYKLERAHHNRPGARVHDISLTRTGDAISVIYSAPDDPGRDSPSEWHPGFRHFWSGGYGSEGDGQWQEFAGHHFRVRPEPADFPAVAGIETGPGRGHIVSQGVGERFAAFDEREGRLTLYQATGSGLEQRFEQVYSADIDTVGGGRIAGFSPDGRAFAYIDVDGNLNVLYRREAGWELVSREIIGGGEVSNLRFEGLNIIVEYRVAQEDPYQFEVREREFPVQNGFVQYGSDRSLERIDERAQIARMFGIPEEDDWRVASDTDRQVFVALKESPGRLRIRRFNGEIHAPYAQIDLRPLPNRRHYSLSADGRLLAVQTSERLVELFALDGEELRSIGRQPIPLRTRLTGVEAAADSSNVVLRYEAQDSGEKYRREVRSITLNIEGDLSAIDGEGIDQPVAVEETQRPPTVSKRPAPVETHGRAVPEPARFRINESGTRIWIERGGAAIVTIADMVHDVMTDRHGSGGFEGQEEPVKQWKTAGEGLRLERFTVTVPLEGGSAELEVVYSQSKQMYYIDSRKLSGLSHEQVLATLMESSRRLGMWAARPEKGTVVGSFPLGRLNPANWPVINAIMNWIFSYIIKGYGGALNALRDMQRSLDVSSLELAWVPRSVIDESQGEGDTLPVLIFRLDSRNAPRDVQALKDLAGEDPMDQYEGYKTILNYETPDTPVQFDRIRDEEALGGHATDSGLTYRIRRGGHPIEEVMVAIAREVYEDALPLPETANGSSGNDGEIDWESYIDKDASGGVSYSAHTVNGREIRISVVPDGKNWRLDTAAIEYAFKEQGGYNVDDMLTRVSARLDSHLSNSYLGAVEVGPANSDEESDLLHLMDQPFVQSVELVNEEIPIRELGSKNFVKRRAFIVTVEGEQARLRYWGGYKERAPFSEHPVIIRFE